MKLEKKIDQLKSLDLQVIAISKSSSKDSQKTKNKTNGLFTFISDPSGLFIDSLGLLDKGGNPFNGDDSARISKMLVDKEKNILWFRFTENNRVRIASNELISELRGAIKTHKQLNINDL